MRWASRPRGRLAVIGSPLPVRRETMETAAVVTRVAPSFLRFGHFEHFAHIGQRRGGAATPARGDDRPLLPRTARRMPQPAAALLEGGGAAHRAADGAMAGGGLLPRRDEHRQHVLARTDDRLRTVRLPGRLRPRPRLQPQRRPGPLCLRAPAERGVLEPACAGAGAAAGGRRPARGSQRVAAGRARTVQGRVRSGHAGGAARQARPGRRTTQATRR